MGVKKQLNKILQPKRIVKGHYHATHIILFSEGKDAPSEYALCFEDQIELACGFLQTKNVEFITVLELGKTTFTYQNESAN